MSSHKKQNSKHPPTRSTKELTKALRAAAGQTQQQFANQLNIAISSLVRYEAGKPISESALIKMVHLAHELGNQQLASEIADYYYSQKLAADGIDEQLIALQHVLRQPNTNAEDVMFVLKQTSSYSRIAENEAKFQSNVKIMRRFLSCVRRIIPELDRIHSGITEACPQEAQDLRWTIDELRKTLFESEEEPVQ